MLVPNNLGTSDIVRDKVQQGGLSAVKSIDHIDGSGPGLMQQQCCFAVRRSEFFIGRHRDIMEHGGRFWNMKFRAGSPRRSEVTGKVVQTDILGRHRGRNPALFVVLNESEIVVIGLPCPIGVAEIFAQCFRFRIVGIDIDPTVFCKVKIPKWPAVLDKRLS